MIIELNNVTYKRDQSIILNNINWHIEQGEHWCILGLNGSGKTTLLNIINGYQWPSTGQVSVLGHQFGSYDLRELRKKIGWVSSSLQTKLHEGETALNIILSGKHSTIGIYNEITGEDVLRAEDLVQKFNLSQLKNNAYRVLSQGEKQKVLIARALMNNPDLLILDEPCTGLDFIARQEVLDTVEIMAKQYTTTLIYVTHHIDEIRSFLSHTMLLKEGLIFEQGETTKLINSEILSAFFGRPVHVAKENDLFWLTMKK